MVRNNFRVVSLGCHRLARWNVTFLATSALALNISLPCLQRRLRRCCKQGGKRDIRGRRSCSKERKDPPGKPVALKCGS